MILLCVVYVVSALITSGFRGQKEAVSPKEQIREYFRFIKQQCLPVGVLLVVLLAAAMVGQVLSMPILRAGALSGPAYGRGWRVRPGHRPDLLQ